MNRKVYFGDWEKSGFLGMVRDFEGYRGGKEPSEQAKAERWQNMEVLFAAYTYEDYEGDAFVLFKRDGKLYEVNGGHCSCYGLSESGINGDAPDQWEPEETTAEAIKTRLRDGRSIFGVFRNEIESALEAA